MDANADIGNSDPFAGDVNFGVLVNETGGKLFFNRNDVDAEIRRSQQLGSEYYTLTYQPHDGDADGKFRRVGHILDAIYEHFNPRDALSSRASQQSEMIS